MDHPELVTEGWEVFSHPNNQKGETEMAEMITDREVDYTIDFFQHHFSGQHATLITVVNAANDISRVSGWPVWKVIARAKELYP